MAIRPKSLLEIVKRTLGEFIRDDCPQMAAALAYYTVFSLPPLLVLLIIIVGVALGRPAVEGRLASEISLLVGPEAADQIQSMISSTSERLSTQGGLLPTILGVAALILGATGAFAQLQLALNRAWEVQPDPDLGGVKKFFMKRALSFGMILATGFLLLVSLVLSALVSALGQRVQEYASFIPFDVSTASDLALSVLVITVLFAAIFKILPDAVIAWRDVWVGAGVTAAMFVIGKLAIGIYLGQSNPGSMFGAAGSLALVLLWIYFSSLILLLGAEFTQVWARRKGKQIMPSRGAVRVVRETHKEDSPAT